MRFPLPLLLLGCIPLTAAAQQQSADKAPAVQDFLGINGHTVQFRPQLYRPICRLVRDYHGMNWDVGDDTSYAPKFPMARNGVNWNDHVYGKWKAAGFETNCSLMFHGFEPPKWKDVQRDAYNYGKAFAAAFGPSSNLKLVASAEIGNEPGFLDDDFYRELFAAMAKGLRDGDPKLQIVTCAAINGKSHKYAKSLQCVQGLDKLYDVINVHSYAQVKGWPTWERSYPEDSKLDYLKDIRAALKWRDQHAPGKPLWVTEYGWDCCTKPAPKQGTFSKWTDVTDLQQAQYLVRSTMVFMNLQVDRAYIYWFNDDDKPQVHGSSGITRNFQPKPSYHALKHFMATLGKLRLVRAEQGDEYVYTYRSPAGGATVVAAWLPSGSGAEREATIPLPKGFQFARAEAMPVSTKAPPKVAVKLGKRADGSPTATLKLGESPVYLLAK